MPTPSRESFQANQPEPELCITSTQFHAPCYLCGERPQVQHMPRGEAGLYCELCCPVCNRPPSG